MRRRLQVAILRSVEGLVASRRSARRRSVVAVLTQLDELVRATERRVGVKSGRVTGESEGRRG
jgi:hypothetical protein